MTEKQLQPNQFADRSGHIWTIDINVDAIEQVHRETNVSLYTLIDDKLKRLAELLDNLPAFAHVCYLLVGAEAAKVDRPTFARTIKGDVVDAMVNAFLEELKDFFPDARRRAAIGKLVQSIQKFQNLAMDQVTDNLAKIDPDQIARSVLTQIMSKPSGVSPAAPDSSPASCDGSS